MTIKKQTERNIDLTEKLIQYILNGKDVPKLPDDISFVPFSKDDDKLNKANQELLEIISKDKPVAIAEEPKTSKESWKITPVNF